MHNYDQPRRLLAYGIAALAGFMDALGFIAANGYFVSFMSGNTTRLGVHLGEDIAARLALVGSAAIVPLLLIVTFVGGVTLGAALAERTAPRHKSAVLALSSALIAIAAVGHLIGSKVLLLGGAVIAMGAINNAFRRNGEVTVGVTYMTGALVRFGQGLAARLTGRPFVGALASLALWFSLALGAVLGALAITVAPNIAYWLPLAAALLLLAAARRLERRLAARAAPRAAPDI